MTEAQQQQATTEGNIVTLKKKWSDKSRQIIIKEAFALSDGYCVLHNFGQLFYNSEQAYSDAIDWEWMEENVDF